MRRAQIVHIIRQAGSLLVTALTAASTLNAYRPLARRGNLSIFSWMFGMIVTELPLQTLASQLSGLALTGEPPSLAGAVNATVACPLPAVALPIEGASGTVTGAPGAVGAVGLDAALVPMALAAVTVNV